MDQRERVRHALRETFLKGLQRLNDEASAASRCALLAWELELELTRLIGPQDTPEKKEAFRKKYMSLKFNLDDPKNPQVPHTLPSNQAIYRIQGLTSCLEMDRFP